MHYDDLPRFAKLNAIKQVPNGYSVYDYRYTEEGLIMTCIREKRHETALEQLEQSIREYKKLANTRILRTSWNSRGYWKRPYKRSNHG